MSDLGTQQPSERSSGFRLLAFVAVSIGLLLLAGAAFVLSYAGVHALALSAGVPQRLARLYPLIFDAMLVIVCAAILSLRGAGLPSRFYAWLSLLVLLVAVASADGLHATGTSLPRRPAAAAAAVIPWALVLIGFGLLVAMLRHSRLRRMGRAPQEPPIRRGGLAALGFAPEPPALPAGFATESGAGAGYAPELEQYLEGDPVPAPGTGPAPLAAAAELESAAETGSGSVVTAQLEPAAQETPGAVVTAELEPAAEEAPGAVVTAELEPAAEEVPGPVVTAELEPAAEEVSGSAVTADLEPAELEATPEPGATPFDRVRSSPIPPES